MIFLFLTFFFLLIYSYLVFPSTIGLFNKYNLPSKIETGRKLVVVIAAWNEEKNLEETIRSVFNTKSAENIERLLIGDDSSTDNSISILERLKSEFPKLSVERFERIGKPSIVNRIIDKYGLATNSYNIVFMDANISLDENCIEELEALISRQGVGIAGASIKPKNNETNMESDYILRENQIKFKESNAFGYVVGIFGGCYMMKGELFEQTPKDYITDDLFQSFQVIEKGNSILYSKDAVAYEKINAVVKDEFRRKRRYGAGNFQIMSRFWELLIFPSKASLGFQYCYFFHKVVRWISPVIFSLFWILSLFGFFGSYSAYIFGLGALILVFLLFNYCLQKSSKFILGKRFYYFLTMNLAIVIGFIDFIKGVQTNVWERSERN